MPAVFLKEIIDESEDRWGDPTENIGRLIPFGIAGVDENLLGVPIDRGGVIGLQGVPGSRKTTLLVNILINQCLSGRLPPGYHIGIDTLESGMTIERYADVILAIVATKFLVYWHWNETSERDIIKLLRMGLPERNPAEIIYDVGYVQDGKLVGEAKFRPEFFIYGMRTKRQLEAIKMAKAVVRNFPIMIFGVSEHPDIEVAKRRTTDVTNLERSHKRWHEMAEEHNMRELAIDHLQEYYLPGASNDYEKMQMVVSAAAQWQKVWRAVLWMLSQIGVTSERESRKSGISAYAQGGKVLEAESQVMWQVEYNSVEPYIIELLRPIKSRIGMHGKIAIPIDPTSGAFIGRAGKYVDLGNV